MPKRPFRFVPRTLRSRASKKPPAKKRKLMTRRIRTAPVSAPNVYNFTRGFDSFATVGITSGIFAMNTDNRYQVINLRTRFSDMPQFTEFNSLFSEYKIKTFSVNLVPTLKQNVGANNIIVSNFQVFAVPVNYTDDEQDFSLLSSAEIDSFLNQTQRKSMRLMPNRPKMYVTRKPRVPKYEGPLNVTGGTSTIAMGTPYWLSTGPPATGAQDERNVYHYGMRLLIRRVDGGVINPALNPMGFRVQHQVNFACRKVQ